MKLEQILSGIEYTYAAPKKAIAEAEIARVEYNSRKSCAGDLFVCLTGLRSDGHVYAAQAYENGCRTFLCEHDIDLPDDALRVITPDTRAALPVISAQFYGRPADSLTIIGITGTKGKTTTALLTQAIFNASGMNCAYIGSNGVIINGRQTETVNTTPESRDLHHYFRLMVESDVKYAVLEVSSQALSHHRVDGIRFDTVVFTNFSEDHIGEGEHTDIDDYRRAKKRLFTDFGASNAVYNADDPTSEYMLNAFSGNRISIAIDTAATLRAGNLSRYRTKTTLGVEFDCTSYGVRNHVKLMSPGEFSIYNGLSAMAIAWLYGISPTFSANVLEHTPVQGRFEVVEGVPDRTFIVDYSHNGLSLTKALETLRLYNPERLICVFGSVGRTQCRRKELADAASALADYCIITTDNPDYEDPGKIIDEIADNMSCGCPYEKIISRRDAIYAAVNMSRPGDIVLFAGKGHETYQMVCGRKVPFVERDIIKEASREMARILN